MKALRVTLLALGFAAVLVAPTAQKPVDTEQTSAVASIFIA
jgi:hypothetical protein